MVDYAASRQPPDTRIKWRQADALALPFENAAFDLVCCQFGAMFFPDRTSGYREAKRVPKPGGHFLFNVWDRIEENVFADDVTNALAKIFPNELPRFLARTPHGYHDTALIRSELEEAGFSRVVIETRAEQSRASSPRLPAVAYCQGTLLRNEMKRQRRWKTRICNRLRRIRDCGQTWPRRGCCQNSGTRNRGCGLNVGISPSGT